MIYADVSPVKNEMLVRTLRPDSHCVRKAAKAIAWGFNGSPGQPPKLPAHENNTREQAFRVPELTLQQGNGCCALATVYFFLPFALDCQWLSETYFQNTTGKWPLRKPQRTQHCFSSFLTSIIFLWITEGFPRRTDLTEVQEGYNRICIKMCLLWSEYYHS